MKVSVLALKLIFKAFSFERHSRLPKRTCSARVFVISVKPTRNIAKTCLRRLHSLNFGFRIKLKDDNIPEGETNGVFFFHSSKTITCSIQIV